MPYIDLFGYKMHYEEQGSGEPDPAAARQSFVRLLMAEGDARASQAWPGYRHRSHGLRPIGLSQTIEYSFFQHATFLEEFIDQKALKNITLIIQDWGSALGFDYAARHEDNVRGIMFYEAIIKPYATWAEFPKSDPNDPSRNLFQDMRQGDKDGPGWELNVGQNVFITSFCRGCLTSSYPQTRWPNTRSPSRSLSGGSRSGVSRRSSPSPAIQPTSVTVGKYTATMMRSNLPKLLIWSSTGATLVEEHVQWLQRHFKNLSIVKLNSGVHFFQESNIDEFLQAFTAWFTERCLEKI